MVFLITSYIDEASKHDQHFVSVTIFGAASVSCEDRNNINDAGGGETEQTNEIFLIT